jgi:hypothetical protein
MLHQSLETLSRIQVGCETKELLGKLILVSQHGSGLHERSGVEDQKSMVDGRNGLGVRWISIARVPSIYKFVFLKTYEGPKMASVHMEKLGD